ncbi:DUF6924 domain-containing protein [Plantactinospora sonchi]|uniref:DUF6924 domain-containing protein n=1 Tax=Plantactinospora sonchi TaxID=1544735 RepID=A0ABU7RPG5_9ACTN
MATLPQPDDLTSLLLRTDFRDDAAWDEVVTAVNGQEEYPHATCVSDPAYAEVSVQRLVEIDTAAGDDAALTYLFLADATTMTDDERPLLAVDLYDEPGRTFRVPPQWFAEISANLCIANLDFADFADDVDASGTYRGLGEA